MTRFAVVLATVGGAGYAPIAPGTVGSAVGVLLYAATRFWTPAAQVALLVAISLIGIWAANEAGRHFQNADPGQVVIDEVAGQMLTLLLLDVGLVGMGLAFVVFRVLDIAKPWPVRQFEALHGGLGVMADDLMAGVYGWLAMYALMWLVPAAL